ncbi:MAG: multidrug efflux SMR transporter, partial [Eubacterium sp.]|nr:multidrug efflux SMR transporter [Candidatus Colimonas fimequi]
MWNVTKVQAYWILMGSILCEVLGSCCLEGCNGFQNKLLSVATLVCYGLAFYSFSKILHIINIAVGYATWTAVGSIATAVVSQFFFKDPISLVGWAAIVGLCIGVVGLNLFGTPKE